MNPVYKKALEKIWSKINVGVQHPNDFEKVVDMFDRLLSAAERVDSEDQIRKYYEQLGAPQEDARDISMIYHVLEISHKRKKWWSDEFMQEILEAS